jgi:hypothetical protein
VCDHRPVAKTPNYTTLPVASDTGASFAGRQ